MQNKANFRKSQINVNPYYTTDYENISDWTLSENKPNSKPNKPNFRKAKMNENLFATKVYENETYLRTPPKQTQSNPIQRPKNAAAEESYKVLTAFSVNLMMSFIIRTERYG